MPKLDTYTCDNPNCSTQGESLPLGNHIWLFKFCDGFSGDPYFFCSPECVTARFTTDPIVTASNIPEPEIVIEEKPNV